MSDGWSLVTVTYNSREHLERNWTHRREDRDYTWIVVDNGSTDGSYEFAQDAADVVIAAGGNKGFAVANNLGLAAAGTPYVAFVNPDVKVQGSQWQARLSDMIEATGGLVAPQLLYPDGSEQPNARGLPFLRSKIRNRVRPDTEEGKQYARTGFDCPTYCAWVMGAALAGRAETFGRLGGWDEGYFLYYEDHDIGLRAWQAGVPVVVDPGVRWQHEWQRETTGINTAAWRHELRSMRRFFSTYPQFLYGSPDSSAYLERLRKVGLESMLENLWSPVPQNGGFCG